MLCQKILFPFALPLAQPGSADTTFLTNRDDWGWKKWHCYTPTSFFGHAWPGGGCDSILLEGDLVLSINGKPVTKPHDAWPKMRKMRTRELGKSGWNWDI